MPEIKKKVGVRYCGGCNPRYDRLAAAEKTEADVTSALAAKGVSVGFEKVEEGAVYDALLVVSGCMNRCASIEQYKVITPPVHISEATDLDQVSVQLVGILS